MRPIAPRSKRPPCRKSGRFTRYGSFAVRDRTLPGGCAALLLCLAALTGCDSGPSARSGNVRPTVLLTVPAPGERLPYTTTFRWAGSDPDGVVDRFEYAIDVPDSVSLDELNDPEYRGVTWTATTAKEMRFTFSTPDPDTARDDGSVITRAADVGEHCFFVRSVDDDGAPSRVDFHCFTAENVHPKTTIRVRETQCTFLDGNGIFNLPGAPRVAVLIHLDGEDPDSPDPARKPAWFEWKRIPVASVLQLPPEDLTHVVNVSPGPDFPWVRADTESVTVPLASPGGYIVAVRAVDEHGGTENRFRRFQATRRVPPGEPSIGNALVVAILSSNHGSPILTVCERTLGCHRFPVDGPVADWEVFAGLPLTFDFQIDTSAYGGVLDGYSWGVDVKTIEDDSQFSDWSQVPVAGPMSFDSPGIHAVTIRARDCSGSLTIGTILLRVIPFLRDREVLYIDDYRQGGPGGSTDAMMDARAIAMLEAAGYAREAIHTLNVWGDDDLAIEPMMIRLADLARYRLVVWSNSPGLGGSNALVEAAACGRVVQQYLAAGGNLWIFGDQVWGSFRPFGSSCRATQGYDQSSGLDFAAGHFPCEFMKICGGSFRNARQSPQLHGLVRAVPTSVADGESFSDMEVDSTVFLQPGGLPYVDAMFQPTFDVDGGLDTLYTMRAPGTSSPFNNKPVAFRYYDPDPASSQGAVAVFGFSFHLLKQGSGPDRTGVHGMAQAMVDWFRSRQRGL